MFKSCSLVVVVAAGGSLVAANSAATTSAPLCDGGGLFLNCESGCLAYYDGCNDCHCDTETGGYACTEMACVTQGTPECYDENTSCIADIPVATTNPTQAICDAHLFDNCTNGCSSYFDGCNNCFCDAESAPTPVCTRMACDDLDPPLCLDENTTCVPHTATTTAAPAACGQGLFENCDGGCLSYDDGCNVCDCDAETGLARCTTIACFTQGTPECFDEDTTCRPAVGQAASTTPPSASSSPSSSSSFSPRGPPPKCGQQLFTNCDGCTHYSDGCNTCSCVQDEMAGCTERYCAVPGVPECFDEDTTCVPAAAAEPAPICGGEYFTGCSGCARFSDGCNTCSCDEHGSTGCTEMLCDLRGDPECFDERSTCKIKALIANGAADTGGASSARVAWAGAAYTAVSYWAAR